MIEDIDSVDWIYSLNAEVSQSSPQQFRALKNCDAKPTGNQIVKLT